MEVVIVAWIIHAVVCAVFSLSIAESKGRSGWWFFSGLLFGIIGMLAVGLHEKVLDGKQAQDIQAERVRPKHLSQAKRERLERDTQGERLKRETQDLRKQSQLISSTRGTAKDVLILLGVLLGVLGAMIILAFLGSIIFQYP